MTTIEPDSNSYEAGYHFLPLPSLGVSYYIDACLMDYQARPPIRYGTAREWGRRARIVAEAFGIDLSGITQ